MKIIKIGALIAIPIAYNMWIQPTYTAIQETDEAHIELRAERESKLLTLKGFQQLRDELGDSVEALEVSLAKVPQHIEQENLIRDIRKMAEENDFTISGLGFSTSLENQTGANQVNISFSIEGDYDKFAGFLESVEQADRFYGIENFAVSFSDPEEDENTKNKVKKLTKKDKKVSMGIALYTYYQGS